MTNKNAPQSVEGRYIDPSDMKEHDLKNKLHTPHSPIIVIAVLGVVAIFAFAGFLFFTTSLNA